MWATSTPSPSPTARAVPLPPGGAGALGERPDRHPVRGRLRRGLHGHRRNPNGSLEAIEGIFSPDGRVFGKMGHSERRGPYGRLNIPGDKHQPLFESGAAFTSVDAKSPRCAGISTCRNVFSSGCDF